MSVRLRSSHKNSQGVLKPLHRYVVPWLNGSFGPPVLGFVALHLFLQKGCQLLLVLVLSLLVGKTTDIGEVGRPRTSRVDPLAVYVFELPVVYRKWFVYAASLETVARLAISVYEVSPRHL